MRVRARPAVRYLPAHPVAPPREATHRRDRGFRAAWPVGLLLRQTRSTEGALCMAELTDIRESVRQRYAAAAKRAATEDPAHGTAGCCGGSGASSSPADATGVFGADLYD